MHRPVVFPERGHSWFAGVVAFHFLCFSSPLPVAQRLPFHVHVSPGWSYYPFVRSALLVCRVAPLLCAMCAIDFARPFVQARLVKKVFCVTCIDPLSSLSMRPLLVRGRGCIPFLLFLFPSSGCSTLAVSCSERARLVMSMFCLISASGPSRCTLVVCDVRD